MSTVADNRRNMLEEVKEAAHKLTLRRLEDDGFDLKEHNRKEEEINAAEDAVHNTNAKAKK